MVHITLIGIYLKVEPMEYCNNGKMLYIKPPAYEWLNMSSRFHAALFAIFNETFCYTMHEWLVNKYVSLVGNEVEIMRHSHVPTNIFQEWQFFFRLILIITFYAYLHSILFKQNWHQRVYSKFLKYSNVLVY